MKQPKPSYPRIGCSIPGCKRGATCFEPGTRFICGKCWRRAPKDVRRWYTYWRRKAVTLEKREDPRADACHWRASAKWEEVYRLLTERDVDDGTLPPLLEEELRKVGLV